MATLIFVAGLNLVQLIYADGCIYIYIYRSENFLVLQFVKNVNLRISLISDMSLFRFDEN